MTSEPSRRERVGAAWLMVFNLTLGFTALCTFMAMLGRHWWVFELTTHFRVQYVVMLTICALAFVTRLRYRLGFLASCLLVMNLYHFAPKELEAHAGSLTRDRAGGSYRAVLFNINHDSHASLELYEFIGRVRPDFVVLLEVNARWMKELQTLRASYPYQRGLAHEKYGIVLMSRQPLESARVVDFVGNGLPSVVATLQLEGTTVRLIGTHPRSPMNGSDALERNVHLERLGREVAGEPVPTVVLGDLNVTPWSPFFHDLLAQSGLKDSRNGFGVQATWPTTFPPLWIPIDHCLVSSDIVVRDRWIGPDLGSDHYPLVVEFSVGI